MRREPTAEQKARAAERRERFRGFIAKVKAMTPEQRAALAARLPGVVTVEGHPLSLHNLCLIAYQRQDVTLVGGFRQWQRHGRKVSKGQHGLMIWIPRIRKNGNGEHEDQDGETPDEVRFLMGTVFDVSQTEEIEQEQDEPAGELAAVA